MIDLRYMYVRTENEDETAALLGMATAQGFKWKSGYKPLSKRVPWRERRLFCFCDDKKIIWRAEPDAEFENFSDLISGSKESERIEETERSISQADFCKAAAEFFRCTETNCAEDIGLAFSILERKLFPYTEN